MTIVTEHQLNTKLWEYTVSAQLTNTGVSLSGVIAKMVQMPNALQVTEDTLVFGRVNQGDTIGSSDTVTVQSSKKLSASTFKQGFKWSVILIP
jgi:hypothetical protein